MLAVENETILHASPPRVWTALTRFDDYSRWNPFIRIDGPLARDALVQYSFRMKAGKARFFTVDARIIALEPQSRVTFRFGFGWLLAFEESYCVAPVPVGSRLVHSFRCTGLLSALKLKNMRRNFGQMLEIMDRLFQRQLSPARPPASAKKRVRKGFRPGA
ncbi:SRPBCC domain-containing protein [Sphingopyxis chilensis]